MDVLLLWVVRIALSSGLASQELEKLLDRKIRLPQDGVKIALRYVAGMVGDRDAKLRKGVVAKLNVAAGLVVDVEAGSEESPDDLARLQNRQLRRHGA